MEGCGSYRAGEVAAKAVEAWIEARALQPGVAQKLCAKPRSLRAIAQTLLWSLARATSGVARSRRERRAEDGDELGKREGTSVARGLAWRWARGVSRVVLWGVSWGVSGALAGAMVAGCLAPAGAQEAAVAEAGAQDACIPGPNALGVSRTVELDASSGPRFGTPYKEQDILADGEVVLTFDDGPLRAYTRHVLDALQAHCTKATFFLVGRMAVTDPEMVREYARLGHTVGIHTWSHQNLHRLTPLRARREIELGFSAVQQALGKPVAPFFRFPYLADTPSMTLHLQERHIAIFSIDVDSKDYRTRNPEAVHRKVMTDLARAKKGIILFHDIQPSTARALPGLLADLKAKGYRIVHLQPKAGATTMAEFDATAQQELERRQAMAASQPLSRRAFTWPVTGVHAEPAVARERVRSTPRHGQRYPKPDWFSNAARW